MTEFIFGALSVIVQACVGHPFDTYKIRLQNNEILFSNNHLFRGIFYPIHTLYFTQYKNT